MQLLATTSVVSPEELDTSISSFLEDSQNIRSLGDEACEVDCVPINEGGLPLPSPLECLVPEIKAAAAQPLDIVTITDPSLDIHNDFNHHLWTSAGEAVGFPLAPSSSYIFEPDTITWDNFDTSDFDWCLLTSPLSESMESDTRDPPLLDDPDGSKAQLAETVTRTASTATVVERSWYTRLEPSDSTQPNSSDYKASDPVSSGFEGTPNTEIDEIYRQGLSGRLRPRWKEEPLPSIEFLVRVAMQDLDYSSSLLISPLSRVFVSKCISTAQILHCPFCTLPRFVQLPRMAVCCSQSAP